MPNQIEKLRAHTAHVLDLAIVLRERYAMLDPLVFDEAVVTAFGSTDRAHGFRILRVSMFLSCAQEIAKICLDRYSSSPSIQSIFETLEDTTVREVLCGDYSTREALFEHKELEPEVKTALRRSHEVERQRLQREFKERYDEALGLWTDFRASKVLASFSTVRNKVSAHADLRFTDGAYRPIDIGELGLKWGDLKHSIRCIQDMVELLNIIVRSASFAWDMLDEQLHAASSQFWRLANDAT
ncbi:MAG: hypothetical protein AAF270_10650 [Pseudomonadota bacterium]